MSKLKYQIVHQVNGGFQVRRFSYKTIERIFNNRVDAERYVQRLVEEDGLKAAFKAMDQVEDETAMDGHYTGDKRIADYKNKS